MRWRLEGAVEALRSSVPWVMLSAALALTAAGWLGLERNRVDEARTQFERRTETAEAAIRDGHADAVAGMGDLALQVGQVDAVVIDDAERADPGRREVEEERRAEPAGADDEDARGEQLRLTLLADLVEDEMAGIAMELCLCEFHMPVHYHIPSNRAVER